MQKLEIINAVTELVQDGSGGMRGNIGRWVNLVLNDIASRGLLKSLEREEQFLLVAGDGVSMITGRDYTITSTTDKILKVFIPALGGDAVLTKASYDELLQLMSIDGFANQGKPRYYTMIGFTTMRLHPIPSTDYAPANPTDLQKLWVASYKDVAQLSENDNITEFKIKHIPCILAGAYAYGARFDSLGDYSSTKAEYENLIVRLFHDQESDVDRPRATAYYDY